MNRADGGRAERAIAGLPSHVAALYAVLFLIALGVYASVWRDAPILEGDSPQYLEVAKDLSDFRLDSLHERTPGYPILLLITGSAEQPTRSLLFVALLLHFASVWLLAAVLRAAGVRSLWLVVYAGLLLLPSYVEPAGYVMTENLAQFTLTAGFSCLVLSFVTRSPVLLAVAALAFGFSGLTRPVYQALPFVLAVCVIGVPALFGGSGIRLRDRVRAAVAVVAVSIVMVGAVAAINYARFHYFGVAPTLGFHVSTKTMLFVERLPDEYAAVREVLVRERDAQLTKRGGTHTATQTIWSARSELAALTGLTTPQLSNYLVRMNLALIRRAPLEYLQEVARSMAGYWFPAIGPLAGLHFRPLRWLAVFVHTVVVLTLLVELVVLVGVSIFARSLRVASSAISPLALPIRVRFPEALAYVLAAIIVFYTMALSCAIDIGEPRQRRSTDVFVLFVCFLGTHVWRRTIAPVADSGLDQTR